MSAVCKHEQQTGDGVWSHVCLDCGHDFLKAKKEEPKYLWEVLVPTVRNDGRPFRLRYHRIWDERVRQISGGLTIMKPAVGQWVDPATSDLYKDRTIPVRFIATRTEMNEIVDMTCVYYDQLAVLCYRIADEVVMRTREEAERK